MNDVITHKVGDLVTPDPAAGFPRSCLGVVYRIEKMPTGAREVNLKAKPVEGQQEMRGISGPPEVFLPCPDGVAPRPTATVVEHLCPPVGSIVRVNGVKKIDPTVLYVVTADKIDAARLVKVGGENGRYWPKIPAKYLTVVQVVEAP